MKIALLLAWGYRLIAGQPTIGALGGAEIQMTRLARHLRRHGHEVWFLCGDPGDGREQIVNDIHVLPAFRQKGGLPVLRFFQMKRSLENALARADADAYVQRCASPITGIAADWARRNGRTFVYMVASDPNVDGRYELKANLRDRWFYRRGLRTASGIVAQTQWQADQVTARFGRRAMILPSALEIPAIAPPPPRPEFVFWAGGLHSYKRPHLLLEVARRAPDLEFRVAGTRGGHTAYADRFMADLALLPNVKHIGEAPYDEMPALYERSIALFSTSQYEGFSNTFLEAWRAGAPVVSLSVDPDGLIRREGLGAVTEDLDQVVAELRALRDDPARRATIARAARRVIERHSAPAVTATLGRYLEALVSGSDERAAAEMAGGTSAAAAAPADVSTSTRDQSPEGH